MTFAEQLDELGACDEATYWVGKRTLEQAWRDCTRSEWMLWLLRELEIDARRCAGEFALRVWRLVPAESQLACAWTIDCTRRGADDEESDAASAEGSYAARAAEGSYAVSAERRAQCDIIRELIPLAKVRAALNKRTA